MAFNDITTLEHAATPLEENECLNAVVDALNWAKANAWFIRHGGATYQEGDVVQCPYKRNLELICTQGGTTADALLDINDCVDGNEITDGTVKWTVRTGWLSTQGGSMADGASIVFKSNKYAYGIGTAGQEIRKIISDYAFGDSVDTSYYSYDVCTFDRNNVRLTAFETGIYEDGIVSSNIATRSADGTTNWVFRVKSNGELDFRGSTCWDFPNSADYTNLSLPATGKTITMPNDGWLEFACSGSGSYLEAIAGRISATAVTGSGGWGRAFVPVCKGDVVTVYYGGSNFTKQMFRFNRKRLHA